MMIARFPCDHSQLATQESLSNRLRTAKAEAVS
jgi:hypothetical protein